MSRIQLLVNLKGNLIEKHPALHPYDYDEFVIWKGDYDETTSTADWSDRLYQRDPEKFNKCCLEVWNNTKQNFANRKPESVEKFLSLYYERPIELTAITQTCNVGNGNPYWIFYYKKS